MVRCQFAKIFPELQSVGNNFCFCFKIINSLHVLLLDLSWRASLVSGQNPHQDLEQLDVVSQDSLLACSIYQSNKPARAQPSLIQLIKVLLQSAFEFALTKSFKKLDHTCDDKHLKLRVNRRADQQMLFELFRPRACCLLLLLLRIHQVRSYVGANFISQFMLLDLYHLGNFEILVNLFGFFRLFEPKVDVHFEI